MDLMEGKLQQPATNKNCTLPTPLRVLFAFNGSTLALPTLAMMYIINDRAQIPVDMLSAYGAVSFLPWSFKPLYATLDLAWSNTNDQQYQMRTLYGAFSNNRERRRHELLTLLLFCSGASIMCMAVVPPNGIATCFIAAFIQNVATSFAEFLLGLTLLDQVHLHSTSPQLIDNPWIQVQTMPEHDDSARNADEVGEFNGYLSSPLESKQSSETGNQNNNETCDSKPEGTYMPTPESPETLGGIYQGQAATARNVGSLLASVFLLVVLLVRGYAEEMSYQFAIVLLLLTGSLPLTGAFIATRYKVGSPPPPSAVEEAVNGTLVEEQQHFMEADVFLTSQAATTNNSIERHGSILSTTEKATIATLQILVIWVGLKGVIASSALWLGSFCALLSLLILFMIVSVLQQQNHEPDYRLEHPTLHRKVALYLVLKQAMPEAAYQWYGYSYYLFSSEPIMLQVLSLVGSAATTVGSNAYARHIAPRVKSRWDLVRALGITTIVGTAASLLYLFVTVFNSSTIDPKQVVLQNFLIALPISAIASFFGEIRFLPSVALATSSVQFRMGTMDKTANQHCDQQAVLESQKSSGLQYGTYVSCIDFGDQLGTWMMVPTVSALGITRGDWSSMTELILLCAFSGICSLTFLLLLVPSRSEGITSTTARRTSNR